jgi:hypothetical protein
MQWDRTLAFRDAELQMNPGVNSFSDIDGHQVNTPWRQPLGAFTLFEFSPKFDPVASMLVQNHERVLADFYGLTTSFRRDRLKPGVIVLAEEEGRAGRSTSTAHSARVRGRSSAVMIRRTRSTRSATRRRTCRCIRIRPGTG